MGKWMVCEVPRNIADAQLKNAVHSLVRKRWNWNSLSLQHQ